MAKDHILVVDDEEDILVLLKYNLEKAGYEVSCAGNGTEALKRARQQLPSLIVLDLMLPGISGLEVCSLLKNDARTRDVSILMLTAKGEEKDIVRGLEMGADDYVCKPFSPRVLVARVQAVIRRREKPEANAAAPIHAKDITIHPGRYEVLVNGQAVALTRTEFRILHLLAQRPGWVFTRTQIVDGVRGPEYAVTDRAVDVQIVGLRKKLGACGPLIETVRGVGYRFQA